MRKNSLAYFLTVLSDLYLTMVFAIYSDGVVHMLVESLIVYLIYLSISVKILLGSKGEASIF